MSDITTDNINRATLNPLDESKWEIKKVSLKDFPHLDLEHVNENGKNGPIEFYNVDQDNIKVVALDEKTHGLRWVTPSSYSIHPQREVEIVNLALGLQIITDNDPRAVFGVEKEKYDNLKLGYSPNELEFKRYTPTDALAKNVLVPCSRHKILSGAKPKDITNEELEQLNTYVDSIEDAIRIKEEAREDGITLKIACVDNKWKLVKHIPNSEDTVYLVSNTDIALLPIKSIEYTHKKEDGYDITVPGYETFMNTDGVILSNTINVHVPGLPEAQRDAKEKMLASKQVFSIRDLSNIVNSVKQEFLLGSYMANAKPAEHRYRFLTKEDALRAIKSGKVRLNDEIEIGPLDNQG